MDREREVQGVDAGHKTRVEGGDESIAGGGEVNGDEDLASVV